MLTRDRQPPPADETSQITALKDLLDFLQGTNLPPVPWNISPNPAGPSVDALITPGPSNLLKIVQAYAEAIGVSPALRRLNQDTQEYVAYRSDGLNGRTEVYVAIRTPIYCHGEPPDEHTCGTLIAEQDWQTTALVAFEQTTQARSIAPTPFRYERGDHVLMYQQGRRGIAVDTQWWSSPDINEAQIVPYDAVKIVSVAQYVSPVVPWEDRLTREVTLHAGDVDDTALIIPGPWRPILLDGEE